MRWLIYNVLFFIAYLVLLPHFLIRMRRRGGYRAHFRQRFGRYEPDVMERLRERQRVWVHAVSVGESLAAGALLDAMRARDPEMRFVLSTTSSTGYRTCQALVREGDVLIAEGRIVCPHHRIPAAEVIVTNQDGVHIATFTGQAYTGRIPHTFDSLQ